MNSEIRISLEDLVRVNPKISVVLKRNKLKEVHQLIKSRHGSVVNFSKLVGCFWRLMFAILENIQNPTLLLTINICKNLGLKINDIAEKIKSRGVNHSFITIDKFPLIGTHNIVSLIGHSMGDGNVGREGFRFFNMSETMINDVIRLKNGEIKKIIVKRLENKPRLTAEDLSKELNLSASNIRQHLLDLEKDKIITRIKKNAGKGFEWEPTNKLLIEDIKTAS